MATIKNSWEASSWEELEAITSLEEVKAALKAKEIQRLAHKRHYLKKQAVNTRVKELMRERPELFEDLT